MTTCFDSSAVADDADWNNNLNDCVLDYDESSWLGRGQMGERLLAFPHCLISDADLAAADDVLVHDSGVPSAEHRKLKKRLMVLQVLAVLIPVC